MVKTWLLGLLAAWAALIQHVWAFPLDDLRLTLWG